MMINIIFNRKTIVSIIFGCFYSIVYVIGKSIYKTNGLISIYSSGVNILKNLVLFVVILLLAAFVFWLIISFIDKHKLNYKETKMSNKKLFLIIFILILSVYSTALLSLYPGVFSYDMMHINRQALGIFSYDRFQPPIFTYIWHLCILIGKTINLQASTVYAIFQLLLVSFVFDLYILYIKKKDFKVFLISLIFIIFNPVFALFSIIPVKDVPFSLFFGMSIILFYESMNNNNKRAYVFLGITMVLSSLFRNNAIYVYLVFLIILLLFYRNKKLIAITFISIVLFLVIDGPLYNAFNVADGMEREKLSVPIEQISLVVNRNKDDIDDDMKTDISKFFYDYDSIAELYNPRFADYTKELFYSDYYKEHKDEFFSMYLNVFKKYPNEFIVSFLDLNVPMWYQNAKSVDPFAERDYIEINIFENLFNRDSKLPTMQKYYENVASFEAFENIPTIINIFSISFPFWMIILAIFVCIYKENYSNLFPIILLLLLWSTYLLGPVSNCRYVLPFMILYPFLMVLMLNDNANDIIVNDEKDI